MHPPGRKGFKPPAMIRAMPPGAQQGGKENVPNHVQHKHAPVPITRPPIAAAPPQQLAAQQDATATSYFRVLYTKYAPQKKRKNKTFADGFLEIKAGTCTLYTQEGKVSSRSKLTYKGHLEPGIELVIGTHEVELDACITMEEFTSGSCFMTDGAASATGTTTAAYTPMRSVAGFKKVRPAGDGTSKVGPAPLARPLHSLDDPEALVLNQPQLDGGGTATPVVVDPILRRHLRPHQREGVAFLYQCVMGLRMPGMHGAILADEMGLGKTLQILTLIWSLIRQGPKGKPAARKCVVVCPSSLCGNWEEEAKKWLGVERLRCLVVQSGKEASTAEQVNDFKHGAVYQLLILSYESARQHAHTLRGACDLLVCDEGHRLKAAGGNKTMHALLSLECPRRVILSGSPVQNDLGEFFAMINFVAPGLLPEDVGTFQRLFGAPITQAQDRGATLEQRALGEARAAELKRRVSALVLRRTADILHTFLPPLTTHVVWCKPTALQLTMYRHLLGSKHIGEVLRGGGGGGGGGGGERVSEALAAIMQLRKLCNHPCLLPEVLERVGGRVEQGDAADGSGKLMVLVQLLTRIIAAGQRMVVVSTSTKALDIVHTICTQHHWSTVRIDGATDPTRRQDVVTAFNRCNVGQVFLLSTRAGGAGLNLIGANNLVMLDMDWNTAMDTQAMARIHRDGQTRPCAIYRLILTGTLDEKIYQRQLLKGNLADTMLHGGGGKGGGRHGPRFTRDELRDLFTLDEATCCGTRNLLQATGGETWEDERGTVQEDSPLWEAVQHGLVTWVRSSVATVKMDTQPVESKECKESEDGDNVDQESTKSPCNPCDTANMDLQYMYDDDVYQL